MVRKRVVKSGLRSKGRGIRQPVQYFKRSQWTTAFLSVLAGTQGSFSIEPKLSDVPSYTEFSTLYDQYCIKGVKVTLYPKFSQSQINQSTEIVPGVPVSYSINSLGQMASVLDYDGNVAVNMANLVQYQNLKITRGNRTHGRYFKPAVAASVYNGGLANAYAIKKGQWLDCANASVPHYGMYGLVDLTNQAPSGNVDQVYDCKIDYYLAFKNVR